VTNPLTTITSSSSRALVRTSTTTRQPSITPETSAPPLESTADPLVTESKPVLSASSLLTEPNTSAATAGAALSPSSAESNPLPVGAIVGIVLGILLILTFLGFFVWTRKNRRDRDSEGDGDPYWVRRFQELESVQSQSKARLESGPQSPSDNEGTWRRHVSLLRSVMEVNDENMLTTQLTLNLGSRHPVINRPASRLSQISSFFGQNQSQTSPPPSRLGLINEPARDKDEIDFSQPADKWSLLTRTTTPARPASTRSKRSQIASRKTNSVKSSSAGSGGSERRRSAWPFGAIAAAMRPRVEGGHRNGSLEGRRGMEWIRTIVSSDSGFGFNLDPKDRDHSGSRGLPPPPRRGVSPMPPPMVNNPSNGIDNHRGLGGQKEQEQDVHSTNPISPNPPPYYFTQSQPHSDEDTLSPQTEGSRTLYPSSSLRRKRVKKGLAVPDLALARDAVSPNLWVDEDTLDRNDAPTTAALLQMPSVAPLAIAKRGQHPLPPLPQMSKPGPSAYHPELVSRFSADSSRGSVTTDGRQSIPARPQTGRNVEEPAHNRGPERERETDGDSIATRRYDRSAVTPQLPTLSFSGDAFKQEMAEISASTGEDREERVISFHGGRGRDW
jgi:hypothetical protein